MQWFKHDADAATDAKIKKVLIRYGPIGYAVYFHCLELITSDLSESNINFELEHDSEIIADNLKIKGTSEKSGIEIVEEVMRYMVDIGLFENQGGRIFCFKLLRRLDTSMTSNPKMRAFISNARERHDITPNNHDRIMTQSCKNRREENRIEEKREEHPRANGVYNGRPVNSATIKALITEYGQPAVDDYMQRISDYCDANGKRYKDHAATCRNWLKRDKVPTVKSEATEFKGVDGMDELLRRTYG